MRKTAIALFSALLLLASCDTEPSVFAYEGKEYVVVMMSSLGKDSVYSIGDIFPVEKGHSMEDDYPNFRVMAGNIPEGMVFVGWFDDSDGTVSFDSTKAIKEDRILYPVFKKKAGGVDGTYLLFALQTDFKENPDPIVITRDQGIGESYPPIEWEGAKGDSRYVWQLDGNVDESQISSTFRFTPAALGEYEVKGTEIHVIDTGTDFRYEITVRTYKVIYI